MICESSYRGWQHLQCHHYSLTLAPSFSLILNCAPTHYVPSHCGSALPNISTHDRSQHGWRRSCPRYYGRSESGLTPPPTIAIKGYLICALAAFGGIFIGYDYGYVNGVMGMPYFIHQLTGRPYPDGTSDAVDFVIPATNQAVIVTILSVRTF